MAKNTLRLLDKYLPIQCINKWTRQENKIIEFALNSYKLYYMLLVEEMRLRSINRR